MIKTALRLGVASLALTAGAPAFAQSQHPPDAPVPDVADAPSSGTSPDASSANDDAKTGAVPDKVEGYGESSGLDTLVPADDAPPVEAPIASTGNPVLDRLNALEAKVKQLEARNAELETKASFTEDRVQKVEVRAAKGVQPGPAPTFADIAENFTFKPRGLLQLDYGAYNERAGGYDYNNGTNIRRGRFGFDGTMYRVFKWRIEAEYVGQTVNLLDAYVQYAGIPNWTFTVGQHKAPYGLEANSSDAFNEFLERGMANVAFGAVGAERRVGVSAGYANDHITATVGFYGAGEAVGRNAVTPDEAYGVNARFTWEPIVDTGKLVHLGVSGYRATNFAGNAITNLGDRPDTREDGGLIESVTIPGGVSAAGVRTGAKNATYLGGELALVRGPFSVQGEYNHLTVERFAGQPDAKFSGFYAFGTFFITGESRSFKGGVIDRVKPFKNFNPAEGGYGAFELAARYDRLDLTDKNLSPLDKRADSFTAALNWYLNPNMKMLFNYIRFKGENSPLVVAPASINGTTAKGDAFATRLQIDF